MKYLVAVAFLLAFATSASAGVYKTNENIKDRVNNDNNEDAVPLAGVNEILEDSQDRITNGSNDDNAALAGVYKTHEENEDLITNYYNTDASPSAGVNETYAKIEGRITNGYTAYAGQLPYQVGLHVRNYKSSLWCGGSLIGSQWVLTAAHCTIDAVSVTVYLGSIQRSYGTTHTVSRQNIIIHHGYNGYSTNNDIALIQIPAVSLNSPYIQTVKLPSITNYPIAYTGENVIVSGWGRTNTDYYGSKYLQWARLQVITNNVCAAAFGSQIISATICVSTPGGVSTCFGDSGGPMVLENSKVLIGVASFIYSTNCRSGYPSGFTRITSYLDWIKYYTGIYYT
ncbi:hypothetical protein DOY81_008778 [Sarcophaga bullata]|nr:hypothetical protein DOY81_008778 [Sarcophaga bullata]